MPKLARRASLAAALSAVFILAGADGPGTFGPRPEVAGDLPLAFRDDFERDEVGPWEFTDPAAWAVKNVDGNRVLDQHKASKYTPKVRSPFNMALVKGLDVSDFVLDLKVRSTGRDYGHRDLCLFFGHQDPSHFYYVHLGKEADPHAHSVFLVNDAPRVSIAEERTKGTPWTDGWHHVRVVRKVDEGSILVFFDDMSKPIMSARDKTFAHGRVGVGSFDDTGHFDVLQVWGKPAG